MLFHPLHTAIEPPARFTYPFCYEPHPLCLMASAEVQRHIAAPSAWREEACRGKMFGVLVCADADGRLGYLAAFSGQLAGTATLPFFVPPVLDYLQPHGHFKVREAQISAISRRVEALQADDGLRQARERVADAQREAAEAIERGRQLMAQAKLRRHSLRASGGDDEALTRESQHQRAEQRRLKARMQAMVAEAQGELDVRLQAIESLRAERRRMSDELQHWLFDQHRVLNALGHERSLNDIFAEATGGAPPSGAGECCAPKLLQYAYGHGLRPLCMAEFWWGESPVGELRRHLDYYPACRGKCLPILSHMLQGLDVDANPMAQPSAHTLAMVYEDSVMAVVCKPAGLPTVPGKLGVPSVQSLLEDRWAGECRALMVHRLDMATSGLLVVAKTEAAHRHLQAQFEARSTSKTYVALLEAPAISPTEGRICLPLRPDIMDRPRQMVDVEHGREAITLYRQLGTERGHARLALHPVTGRTHQLRVHCAHQWGLGSPILGDTLYGHPCDRLYLHAERLQLVHPETGRRMALKSEADF